MFVFPLNASLRFRCSTFLWSSIRKGDADEKTVVPVWSLVSRCCSDHTAKQENSAMIINPNRRVSYHKLNNLQGRNINDHSIKLATQWCCALVQMCFWLNANIHHKYCVSCEGHWEGWSQSQKVGYSLDRPPVRLSTDIQRQTTFHMHAMGKLYSPINLRGMSLNCGRIPMQMLMLVCR